MTIAYIGLGSNLADPARQIETALKALTTIPDTHLVARSRLYASAPWGKIDQPRFVNAVAQVETGRSARDLLDELLALERRAGRERNADRWGPRILDLDILLYGQTVIDEPSLRIPHPHLHERAFALVPLNEIAPELDVPGRGRLGALLAGVDISTCVVLESSDVVPQ